MLETLPRLVMNPKFTVTVNNFLGCSEHLKEVLKRQLLLNK